METTTDKNVLIKIGQLENIFLNYKINVNLIYIVVVKYKTRETHQNDSLSDSSSTLPTDQTCPLSDPSDPDSTAITIFPFSLSGLDLAALADSAFSLITTLTRDLSDNLL